MLRRQTFCWFSLATMLLCICKQKFQRELLFQQTLETTLQKSEKAHAIALSFQSNLLWSIPPNASMGTKRSKQLPFSSTSSLVILMISRQTEAYKAMQGYNGDETLTLLPQQTDQYQKLLPTVDLGFFYNHASVPEIPITKKTRFFCLILNHLPYPVNNSFLNGFNGLK